MFSFITPYIKAIEIGAVIAILVGDFYFGYHYRALGEEKAIAVAEAQAITRQKAQDQITLDAALADAKAQQHIVTVTQTIIKKVPIYVQKTDACPVSLGYTSVWNLGVAGADQSNAAGQSNATPSGLTAVDALNNAIVNYSTYHQVAQQLTDLQAWVKAQEQVK